MTQDLPSVPAHDGSWWRLINNEWVGWMPGHEGSWTETEAAMEQYFPEVVQRWNDLTKEQP
jgi:hypothetical protein